MAERFNRRIFLERVARGALGLGGLALLGVSSVDCVEPEKMVLLEGTVLEEKYLSPVETRNAAGHYSFSMKTSYGSIAVEVRQGSTANGKLISKESVETLIHPGSKVRVSVPEKNSQSQFFVVTADKITVPNEE